MSRIRMYIYIHNESDATLDLKSREVQSGEFTEGWEPPTRINPGETGKFQGEGDFFVVPTTGTEGNVRYQITAPGGGELYLHWNSPLVESQYGNTFHIWCPPGWDVAHWGGQGHEAELQVRLRRTAERRVPNFNPQKRGFAFKNSGWSSQLPVIRLGFILKNLYGNESCLGGLISTLAQVAIDLTTAGFGRVLASTVDEDWGPTLTDASMGLCGGMVYTVMDYYHNHQLPPTLDSPPSDSNDPLFLYLHRRLIESFDINGDGCRFLSYSSDPYPNGDEGVVQALGIFKGRSWITYRDAWEQIRADIDAGRLSPIGLVQTDSLSGFGNNHQVLVYGYRRSGQEITLFVYDPNVGQQETKLQFNITHTTGEVHVERLPADKRIWAFFRINGYSPQIPPAGRRIQSLKEALLATSPSPLSKSIPISVRSVVPQIGQETSLVNWMRSL
jgi:hypothetical protein